MRWKGFEQFTMTSNPGAQPVTAYGKRVAYIMSRFPRISETFILYEMLEPERLGLQIDVFPLIRQREAVRHAEADGVVARAQYSHALSLKVVRAQWYWLRKRPRAYGRAWWQALRGNISSRKFLVRAVVVVLQAAWIARRLQERGVSHVHAHYASHPALAAYVISVLTDLPYSFTAHAHDIFIRDERPMLAEKVRRARFVVAISRYNQHLITSLCLPDPPSKVVVIHCGVDPGVFTPTLRRSDVEPFTIVCVASLEGYKGHRYLIEACARLKATGLALRCLLVGQGIERPHLEALIAQWELGNVVELLGAQPQQRVKELVARADLVVLPSVVMDNGMQEGIPVALMEALACERAVIATAISGIPELIDHQRTGLLVPPRDAGALAEAIRQVYEQPDRGHCMGQAGRRQVMETFHLQRNAQQLYVLLTQTDPDGTVTARDIHDDVDGQR